MNEESSELKSEADMLREETARLKAEAEALRLAIGTTHQIIAEAFPRTTCFKEANGFTGKISFKRYSSVRRPYFHIVKT